MASDRFIRVTKASADRDKLENLEKFYFAELIFKNQYSRIRYVNAIPIFLSLYNNLGRNVLELYNCSIQAWLATSRTNLDV